MEEGMSGLSLVTEHVIFTVSKWLIQFHRRNIFILLNYSCALLI